MHQVSAWTGQGAHEHTPSPPPPPPQNSARIRHVGLTKVKPMVCLVAVEANDIESTVVCLPHPFPSSPAWYWVQTEISLLDKNIESTTVKLMVVLTVDNSSEAGGMAYFDDITVSFSSEG